MKLILDTREIELKKVCDNLKMVSESFKDIEIIIENLDLGDAIIKDDEDNELVIFERKSIADLIASIKDGRYEEQSFRLNGINHHNHNIIYIIEGQVNKKSYDKKTIFSSIFSINYYKGFSVMRTFNIDETAYYLCNSFLKLKKEKSRTAYYKYNVIKNNNEDEKSYSTVVKKKKNSNITPENFGEIVLCQIPSISSTTALAIMQKFKTINNLIDSINKDEKILNDITYQTDNNIMY